MKEKRTGVSREIREVPLFIITGGSFSNSGAEAMLLITVWELRTRFPGCEIIADLPSDQGWECTFIHRSFNWGMWEYAAAGMVGIAAWWKMQLKKRIGRNESYENSKRIRKNDIEIK